MAGLRKLVVTGATGKQGGALIASLLSRPEPQFEIYAVTRDKTSKRAQALTKSPNVHLVQGDFDHPTEILKQVSNPWGLFSVTMPMNAKKEEAQGKAMTTAALAAGVKHIVLTTNDRGPNNDSDPTVVPHFASKFHIERDIIARAQTSGATWTFLRPVAFFENITNDFLGKGFVAMWRLNGLDYPMQFVSTTDIGTVAAEAFLHADSPEYRNQAISLAGDVLSPARAAEIFREVTGQEIVSTYPFVGRGLKWALYEQLGSMFQWMKDVGYKTDMQEMKRRYPFMKDFRAWLVEESAWKQARA